MNGLLRRLLPALSAVAVAGAAAAPPVTGFGNQVSFEQRLGRQMPTDRLLFDERGEPVRLADYLGAAPVAVVFAYYGCTNLCPTVIRTLAARLAGAQEPSARDMPVLVVSIDPRDAPAQAARMRAKVGGAQGLPQPQRWHFLTGREPDIEALTQAAGFRFAYDAGSKQYGHAAGFLLLTPQGRIARYFFGFGTTSAQIDQALSAASARRIASPVQSLLLLCFHYDPLTGRYSATVMSVLRVLGVGGLLLAGAWLAVRRALRLGRAR